MIYSNGFILIIAVAVVGFLVQMKLKSVFKKYSKVSSPNGLTGKQIAEKMLRDSNIYDVQVVSHPGSLTDHYNPANKTVNLSQGVYDSATVTAAAVAAHECGHAIQHATGYAPLNLRSTLVPVVSLSSSWAQIIIIIGIFTMESVPALFWIGIAMFSAILIFSLITLPVEYNASKRALNWLSTTGTVQGEDYNKAREALTWAARTYLVAAISSLATLVYYLGFSNRD